MLLTPSTFANNVKMSVSFVVFNYFCKICKLCS